MTITCSPNTTYDARSATITVKVAELSETISITQDTGLGLIVSPKDFELTNAAQTIEIEVQKNVEYTVIVDEFCTDWIKLDDTKALTTDKVIFNIAVNTSYDNREGLIHFINNDGLSSDVHVFQKQRDACYITYNPSDYIISYKEQSSKIEVISNIDFEVLADVDWIRYVSTKGLHNTEVELIIEENPSYDKRIGNVTIKPIYSLSGPTVEITQQGKPIDLSKDGPANCYIVPLKDSTYCFSSAFAGNDISHNYFIITGGTHAEVVWESGYGFLSDRLIQNVDYESDNNRIVFNTKQAEGNALIALYDENNNILWSWHIWLTNYDPSEDYITFSNGVVLQDRYLGAVSDEAAGLYYQWGRKDPFSSHKYTYIFRGH